MHLVNLTPHDIVVFSGNGEKVVIPKSGQTVRITSVAVPASYVLVGTTEIPLVETRFGDIEGLPDPKSDVLYVVSALAAQAAAAQGRTDVVAPDTGPESAVRDENGNIIGVRRLTRPSGPPGLEAVSTSALASELARRGVGVSFFPG
ncbi:hypothetical protein [Kyrpidia sp.]|uniref:hypothetical protein n=1 Tax=Kyrpidia sp. TaxID=2073077 RepID=UPI002588BC45|nr:hypothetical protein [Kyrpidia sp.]MCL6577663.1 hypothetical protein [Kyrpidia sp.]